MISNFTRVVFDCCLLVCLFQITGQASNDSDPATEILGLMISELVSDLREMVSLHPVRNISALDMC